MHRTSTRIGSAWAMTLGWATVLLCGCASSWNTSFVAGSRRPEPENVVSATPSAGQQALPASAPESPTSQPHSGVVLANAERPDTPEKALAGVLDQLQEIGMTDPGAQQQLMSQLKQAKPEHYALVVQQYKAALAYRQQLVARDAADEVSLASAERESDDAAIAMASDETADSSAIADLLRRQQQAMQNAALTANHPNLDIRGLEQRQQGNASLVSTTVPAEAAPAPSPALSLLAGQRPAPGSYEAARQDLGMASPAPISSAAGELDTPGANALRTALQSPPPPVTPTSNQLLGATQRSSATQARSAAVANSQPSTSYGVVPNVPVVQGTAATSEPGDWQTPLVAAIDNLETTVRPMPRSTDELHEHMRLRALQMLAGQTEAAYRPIPGAAPGPQDYWSKQLFAMSAYLDGATPDEKQRAAAALVHLDAARSELSELATMQLRNATFVSTVDGYGAYTPVEETRFRPAEQVTVYAEIENFRSVSTRDGYRTLLATSYQVLDDTGRRVDGGQFSEIEDLCHNPRRDFHMQYTIPLPE
ncbi:MAG: hypothetical protein KDA61_20990, partial [Planctomycetales bacterium]|nr:hypothetical protein [Planctomycetales bacterium]